MLRPRALNSDRARAAAAMHVIALAQEHAQEAITTLVTLIRTSESDVVRKVCADSLLDRGFGKPAQQIDVNRMDYSEVVYRTSAEIEAGLRAIMVAVAIA